MSPRHQTPLLALLLALLLLLLLPQPTPARDSFGIACPSLDASVVCRLSARAGFRFTDGCNSVRCGSGDVAASTLIACPRPDADEETRRCQQLEQRVFGDLLGAVSCQRLRAYDVCAAAPAGFGFTDGCNFATCDGNGSVASTTLMMCKAEGLSRKQVAGCEALERIVASRLEPRQCDINATAVCADSGSGFEFSDGCNGIVCDADGQYASTMMLCEPAPLHSAVCRSALATTRRSQQRRQQFACAQLRPESVCAQENVGFSYSDGCNTIRCASLGQFVSTMRYCQPQDSSEAAKSFCDDAARKMRQKRSSSRQHEECLRAEDVCAKDPAARYYDGCNHCFCTGPADAACTRRMCEPFFGTDAEFKEECKRRKARRVE